MLTYLKGDLLSSPAQVQVSKRNILKCLLHIREFAKNSSLTRESYTYGNPLKNGY